MRFVCLGGTDEDSNLVPLCPTCHRLFPHKFSNIITYNAVQHLAEKKAELYQIDAEIAQSIVAAPRHAAYLLLNRKTMRLILNYGMYRRFCEFARALLTNLNPKNVTDRILLARLKVFLGEMALYLDDESSSYSAVGNSLPILQESRQLPEIVRRHSNAIFGRLAGRLGYAIVEQRHLEKSMPSENGPDSGDLYDWFFRMLAFYKKQSDFDNFMRISNEIGDISLIEDDIVQSNILSEIGRVRLLLGEPVAAQNAFQTVMDISMREFHQRGILVTALFAAKCAMAIKHYEDAARQIIIADQVKAGASRKKEYEEIESIKFKLEQCAGRDIFVV